MAKRLSGRQASELIFADESNPEDSESSDEENWPSGIECQLESDGSDQQEEFDEGDDVDMEDSEAVESDDDDDDVLYSVADNPDVGHDTEEDRCAASDSFVSKSSLEKWSSSAATARQARAENVVKGKPGPTSFAKQRVSDENSVVDCFLVFFSPQMLDHIVECTNNEGRRVKQELWTLTSRKELKAFVGLLLLRGVYKASGESTEELWSADGRQDFPSTMANNRLVQCCFNNSILLLSSVTVTCPS